MKKLYKCAVFYAILGAIAGVFYREFTKMTGFQGSSQLSVVHAHTLLLGTIFFLLVMVLDKSFQLNTQKHFNKFLITYNTGLIVMLLMLFVRGVTQVLGSNLSKGASAAISGVAGLGHIIITLGLVFFFITLKKAIEKQQ